MPLALALGLVVAEVSFEVGAVRVEPLARDELSIFEGTHVFLLGLPENVGALSVFVSVGPVARVHILVHVGHDAFSVAAPLFPVAVVFSHVFVSLFSNSRLLVVLP